MFVFRMVLMEGFVLEDFVGGWYDLIIKSFYFSLVYKCVIIEFNKLVRLLVLLLSFKCWIIFKGLFVKYI